MTPPDDLALIRDYEAQIAMYKLRIEVLEAKEKSLEEHIRWMHSSPEIMLKKLTVAGFPAIDVKAIYELLDEWHRLGGTQADIDHWRARENAA